MNKEIENLIEEVKVSDGLNLKLRIENPYIIKDIYLDLSLNKIEDISKLSVSNTLSLYKIMADLTNRIPVNLFHGYSYCKMNSFNFSNAYDWISVVDKFFKEEHLKFDNFNWYINILFNYNDFDYKEFHHIPHRDFLWGLFKQKYENMNALFIYKKDVFTYFSNIKEYIEETYGKDHKFKYVFLNNADQMNEYDMWSNGTEHIQQVIHIQKL